MAGRRLPKEGDVLQQAALCISLESVRCEGGGAAGPGCHDSLWDGEERMYGSFEPCWVNEVMCNLCFLVSTFYSKFAFAELL